MLGPFRRIMKRFVLLLSASFFAYTAGAQIYQWKDESGKTVISDRPPVGSVRVQRKSDTGTSIPPASSTQPSLADRDLEFRKRQRDSQDKAAKLEKEQAAAKEKQEYCTNMRRQLVSLESGERIVRRDDNGERYFLEEAQREQEIAKLRQSMQSNCP